MRLIFKDRPLEIHSLARSAHEAARCAGAGGRYWQYHDLLFEKQPAFRTADLLAYAAVVGVDRAAFARCIDERRYASEVGADLEQAVALGVFSTPTLFVNGRRIEGLVAAYELRRVVEDALKASR